MPNSLLPPRVDVRLPQVGLSHHERCRANALLVRQLERPWWLWYHFRPNVSEGAIKCGGMS